MRLGSLSAEALIFILLGNALSQWVQQCSQPLSPLIYYTTH